VRKNPTGIKTDHLEIDQLIGVGALKAQLTEFHPFVDDLPASLLGNGQAGAAL